MIEGRTKSGFKYSIEEDNIDQELLDALAEADDGNPLKISKVIRLMLGDEQRKRLYDHLRDEKGHVPIKAVIDTFSEILANDGTGGKNS